MSNDECIRCGDPLYGRHPHSNEQGGKGFDMFAERSELLRKARTYLEAIEARDAVISRVRSHVEGCVMAPNNMRRRIGAEVLAILNDEST